MKNDSVWNSKLIILKSQTKLQRLWVVKLTQQPWRSQEVHCLHLTLAQETQLPASFHHHWRHAVRDTHRDFSEVSQAHGKASCVNSGCWKSSYGAPAPPSLVCVHNCLESCIQSVCGLFGAQLFGLWKYCYSGCCFFPCWWVQMGCLQSGCEEQKCHRDFCIHCWCMRLASMHYSETECSKDDVPDSHWRIDCLCFHIQTFPSTLQSWLL